MNKNLENGCSNPHDHFDINQSLITLWGLKFLWYVTANTVWTIGELEMEIDPEEVTEVL